MSVYGTFCGGGAVKLTSTTSNQTFAFPSGYGSVVAYNGGTGTVYLAWNSAASVPSGAWATKLTAIFPGNTIAMSSPIDGGTLNYIADTAGGELTINGGEGF